MMSLVVMKMETVNCSLKLITQDGCPACKFVKEHLNPDDERFEIITLSPENEQSLEIMEKYNVREIPLLVCDCGEGDVQRVTGAKEVLQIINSL